MSLVLALLCRQPTRPSSTTVGAAASALMSPTRSMSSSLPIRPLLCVNNPAIYRGVHSKSRHHHDHAATQHGRRTTCSSSAAAAATHKAESNYKIVQKVIDFDKTQATRPDFQPKSPIRITKHPDPQWQFGEGVRNRQQDHLPRDRISGEEQHREIDPYADDRPMVHNYGLLVSGIAPRPIGLVSTVSADGLSKNLAPFSYFQVVDHDPPMFVLGFSSRPGPGRPKDTYRNLKTTLQCVINTVSEDMIEAVSAASIDAPYGLSEWDVSGLTEAPSATVRPARVRESVFSIEAKVVDVNEFRDHQRDGMSVAGLVLLKATRFWVREDATDAEASHIELDKLRPIAQLGGISYGRIQSIFELPRKRWADEHPKSDFLSKLSKPD